MGRIIYFEETEKRRCAIRFVKNFRKKGWLRKERIEYSFFSIEGTPFIDNEVMAMVCERIKKDYPDAKIYCTEWSEFEKTFNTHKFWVICTYDEKGDAAGYFTHIAGKNVKWTNDIEDAEISLDRKSASDSADNIRKLCGPGARVTVKSVYVNLVNLLLTPIMMITCTSKSGKEETKYFARLKGNRIRLVNTSEAARKFTYTEVLEMYEHLQTHNKNFLYAVLPVFKDNVHYKNLEAYIKEKNVSRMVQMTTKLKWINR